MKPICFMVMPFGTKDVPNGSGKAPSRVNFDRLWEAGIRPAIEALGYEPVRADQDIGALIIHEMLERLYFADLVIADMSIPNGNVYYEIGVRHAAKPDGCVLIAADWSMPLFDVQQMRRLVYPLPSTSLTDDEATAVATCLKNGIPVMRAGLSPMFQVLPGYPTPSEDRALTMRQDLAQMSAFNERVQAVGLQSKELAKQQAMALAAQYPAGSQLRTSVAIALVLMLRDHVGWAEMRSYIEALPPGMRDLALLKEQAALAQSKTGNHVEAIAALEALNQLKGESSERMGLIGGRYKRLAKDAITAGDSRLHQLHLRKAIAAYERGMQLELGNYYCVSNLARLYRERGAKEDEGRAVFAQKLTALMADSAIKRQTADEWARPTLLGAAFDGADIGAANSALEQLRGEGPAAWLFETTIDDLEKSVHQMKDSELQGEFEAVLSEIRSLLP